MLYDSDSYDEDGGSFQLLPSPEHYLNGTGHSPGRVVLKAAATQLVMYDEEEELVSPSSSYTSMSPSASLDQLPPPVQQSERKSVISEVAGKGGDSSRGRARGGSRNNHVQHRNALRLDLMDADEDESVNEEDEEADTQQQQRQRNPSHAVPAQQNGLAKRPSTTSSTSSAPSSSVFSSTVSATSLNRAVDAYLVSTSPVPVPTRPTQAPHVFSSSTSDVSLPSPSYDEYNDSMMSGHSLNDSPAERFERMQRSSREEYDEEDEGDFGDAADVIELEDEERERESSGSAKKMNKRGTRTVSETQAVAAPPPSDHRASSSLQSAPLLSPLPLSVHHSASSAASPFPTASPGLVTSASVPIMSQSSRPLRTVVPMTVRTSSVDPIDDEGEDGDDEHDDQHNEERDDTSSAVISLPARCTGQA